MKILDSKGKLFGKVSIVDIVLIIVILGVCGGIYFRFFGNKGKAVVKHNTFYYTVAVDQVRQPSVDATKESLNNHFFSCEKTGDDMGELTDVEVLPAKSYIECTDGRVVSADMPGYYKLVLKFKIDGMINDKGYYTTNKRAINAGGKYSIKSKYSTLMGVVTEVSK